MKISILTLGSRGDVQPYVALGRGLRAARHADFVYNRMPPVASHFWCECHLNGKWISCELLLDKLLYDGMLKEGFISKEQVPAIDWDGRMDLVLLKPWITKDRGHLPSYDDAMQGLQTSKEGMPPLWIEWIIAPVFYRLNLRNSDQIRLRKQR